MEQRSLTVSTLTHLLLADTRSAALWLVARVYIGWTWLEAGWEKFNNPVWLGDQMGVAISGFVNGALAKTAGAHPDVQWWYADFLQQFVLTHPDLWSHLIVYGELAVGLGLILGCLTGLAAFFGMFMNLNFMLAGSVSVNPIMYTISLGIVLAWRVAGYWGLDRFALPFLRERLRT